MTMEPGESDLETAGDPGGSRHRSRPADHHEGFRRELSYVAREKPKMRHLLAGRGKDCHVEVRLSHGTRPTAVELGGCPASWLSLRR